MSENPRRVIPKNDYIRDYIVRPDPVEAVLISNENIDFAARWCGGEIGNTDNASPVELMYPTLAGAKSVKLGEYLVKDRDTSRFFSMGREEFILKYTAGKFNSLKSTGNYR